MEYCQRDGQYGPPHQRRVNLDAGWAGDWRGQHQGFHHDPDRSDSELDAIQDTARERLKNKTSNVQCTVAFEGLTLDI